MTHEPGDAVSVGTGGAFVPASGGGGATGDITVATNQQTATFTIYGPEDFGTSGVDTGTGDTSFGGSSIGVYQVVWGDLSGYVNPGPMTGILEEDGTLSFTGTYHLVPTGASIVIGGHLWSDELRAYAPSRAIDTNGDWLTTYPSYVTVFGRYQSVNSSEAIQAEKFVGKLNPVVYLPPDSAVDLNWRLERVSDGRIMRVTRIESPSVNVYKKYICEETQEE